ncbi:MAG: acyloxyacyl hydrolase [Rickettsiales bacterium]|nr:acyloxyacyl hydrolase [Rickettsiales bacterium]
MRSLLFSASLLLMTPLAAHAGESIASDRSFLVPYIGVFDVLDNKNSTQFGLEYRYVDIGYGVRPTIGGNVDSDGGAYVYGGLDWDLPLGYSFTLTPNFAVGLYHEGDSKDLGGTLEFRSGLEVSYAFENQSRVGVSFNHVSNASIYDSNPGAETLLVNYQLPLDWFGE